MTNADTKTDAPTRSTDAATLRALLKAAGLRGVSVRAGRDSQAGQLRVAVPVSASQDEASALFRFLRRVDARLWAASLGEMDPVLHRSAQVISFNAAALA